ncbi:MAG: glycosyltransferase involved in cell wall biosynthesis [Halieaceae bacterium]|jgi:glycosyltransferase involved in cell wall biosynthesis
MTDTTVPQPRETSGPRLLSVVVPAYNEEEVLEEFERRTRGALTSLDQAYELVFVNDGSSDGTLTLLLRLRRANPNITVVNLSRNFGKEIALTAGLDQALGDVVVVIDADLQDPPELMGEMIEEWRDGYDVVYAQRLSREGESWFKKSSAAIFYALMQKVGPVRIPADTGDFRLMSRRVVDAVSELREHHRFMKGLFAWVGFAQKSIQYHRDARFGGDSKWSYWRLWKLSLEGITSFTTFPLQLATYIGLIAAVASFVFGLLIVAKTLIFGEAVQGFPLMMTTIVLLGGIQLIALGMIGEYLGRVFNETKNRPLYIIERVEPSAGAQQFAVESQDYKRPTQPQTGHLSI